MAQAVTYICQQAPRMETRKYLDESYKGDERRANLFRTAVRDPWRDGEVSISIIMTWHHFLDCARRKRVSASRLLSLMSMFDRKGIPENLLASQSPAQD